jgi:hypothetical protein
LDDQFAGVMLLLDAFLQGPEVGLAPGLTEDVVKRLVTDSVVLASDAD